MKRAVVVAIAAFLALSSHAQTRIASDIEIRQMEEEAKRASSFEARVTARVNLGELRSERNESAAAQREFETALEIARVERHDARRDRDMPRYALACGWSGVALARLERGTEAFAVFEEATRYSADSPGLWNLYSVAMYRLSLNEKAIGAARLSVAVAERKLGPRPAVRALLELNVHRMALAIGLLEGGDQDEAEEILRGITESLDSDAFQSLRKNLGKREEFQIVTAPTTDSGIYLTTFNRAHMRLAAIYENSGRAEEAGREYQAVVSRRSDEASALAGLARLTSDPKERDRYLIQSLDANPFAAAVVEAYQRHVESGAASPAAGGSAGSRVRLAIQQSHDRNFRGARETLEALMKVHADNDVLLSLLARTALESGDEAAARAATGKMGDTALRAEVEDLLGASSSRPWFLDKPVRLVADPSEAELRTVLSLFSGNALSPADRATLDQEEFSSIVKLDGSEIGSINGVPFRFQTPTDFRSASNPKSLRLTYRILGATTAGGRDALLIESVRVEVGQ